MSVYIGSQQVYINKSLKWYKTKQKIGYHANTLWDVDGVVKVKTQSQTELRICVQKVPKNSKSSIRLALMEHLKSEHKNKIGVYSTAHQALNPLKGKIVC